MGPVVPAAPKKKKVRHPKDLMEPFVPTALPSTPDAERPAPANDVLRGPPSSDSGSARLESGVAMQDFFPLPGQTAEPEEWQKAFMLEGSQVPVPRADMPMDGKPTLWRQAVAAPAPAPLMTSNLTPIPSDIQQRLDSLTRQLEALTTPTPLQSTAELFLFVAVGLLLLLAIDTLLRFATSLATRRPAASSYSGMSGGSWRRYRLH